MTIELSSQAPLYSLAEAYRGAADLLAADFDLGDETQTAAVLDTLDHIGGLLRHKVEAIAGLIRDLDLSAETCDAESKRLAERADSRRKKATWLRDYLLRELGTAELDRIETDRFTVSVRLNPPAVQVLDASAVPSEYTRTTISISVDKRAIAEHVKATGEIVEGTTVTRSQRLVIS